MVNTREPIFYHDTKTVIDEEEIIFTTDAVPAGYLCVLETASIFARMTLGGFGVYAVLKTRYDGVDYDFAIPVSEVNSWIDRITELNQDTVNKAFISNTPLKTYVGSACTISITIKSTNPDTLISGSADVTLSGYLVLPAKL